METELPNSAASEDTVGPPAASPQPAQPSQVGRYRIERLLGKGGFGSVYLAHDDQLQRLVAVKVAHCGRRSGRQGAAEDLTEARTDGPVLSSAREGPEGAALYLAEARAAGGLDHPNIVPVYDFGSTEDCPCFIVSKYIDGYPLTERIRLNRPSSVESAELVATVAEALHYAHRKRLVHRDVKPGNILIDTAGTPFVVDFGLALKEENVGKGLRYAGTPAYMSPEQARGEGHRVDGRSDIFGLGVVFYELLTGLRPFNGDSQAELLEQVRSFEPRPPRQHDDAIPKELERICMKALAKRASERYSTAKELAEDLRHWISTQGPAKPQPGSTEPSMRLSQDQLAQLAQAVKGESSKGTTLARVTSGPRAHIVPKGLRSFDAHDADFFLEILPGPRDREGLPDSIRFWKTHIEETDPDNTFAVGMIYGPSGCGKSSLVKAGLLPRLSVDVITAYVEATAGETERRLLNGLRKRCPALPPNLNLTETLASLRLGRGVPDGKKVLIVLDQFEQWLHAKKEEQDTELVQALRQCDGGRVQCIVMVRDDFWMAATRFMRDLEVPLLEGQNSAAVDLFDTDHARKVLAAFGRAFGRLPEGPRETGSDAKQFLAQAVSGLTREGKVISVRLALFAEMMKGRPWTPASLKEVGGTAGLGVTFLEETFSAATAPPEHRFHQQAARATLMSLLPESGTDIKGHMRSRAELLDASGCAGRPKDFDDLIRILDGEVRLLTPTDPEGQEGACGADPPSSRVQPGNQYYQLTHDYLVPALRDWLTRKQKETRRGRAELLLADRAGIWNVRPEARQLPSFPQWLSIRLLTKKNTWTPPQRKMMNRAMRYHAARGAVLALLVVATIGALAVRVQQKATQASALVQRLNDADTASVPTIVVEIAGYRQWADPLLRRENSQSADTSRQKLRTSLALLPVDPSQVDFLYSRLLAAEPSEVLIIRDALFPYGHAFVERLWSAVQMPEKGDEAQRLRAAAALARYDPDGSRWAQCVPLVLNDLFRENAVYVD
jgi:serine/threonine protein kinase